MPQPLPELIRVLPTRGKLPDTVRLLLAASTDPRTVVIESPFVWATREAVIDAGFLPEGDSALLVEVDPPQVGATFPDLVPSLPSVEVDGSPAFDTGTPALLNGVPIAQAPTSALPGADSADPTKSAAESNPGVEARVQGPAGSVDYEVPVFEDLAVPLADLVAAEDESDAARVEQVAGMTIPEIEDALTHGAFTKDELRQAETAEGGKNRRGVLALADEE